ncbi:hypothetical protein [Rhizorhabdus wittichii]
MLASSGEEMQQTLIRVLMMKLCRHAKAAAIRPASRWLIPEMRAWTSEDGKAQYDRKHMADGDYRLCVVTPAATFRKSTTRNDIAIASLLQKLWRAVSGGCLQSN